MSAIAALSYQGLNALELTDGTVNSNIFFDIVGGSLIPEMQPFDGYNPTSIALMDNCSIHHTQEVAELSLEAGILQIFLPPCSPDLNPIELEFWYVNYGLSQRTSGSTGYYATRRYCSSCF